MVETKGHQHTEQLEKLLRENYDHVVFGPHVISTTYIHRVLKRQLHLNIYTCKLLGSSINAVRLANCCVAGSKQVYNSFVMDRCKSQVSLQRDRNVGISFVRYKWVGQYKKYIDVTHSMVHNNIIC